MEKPKLSVLSEAEVEIGEEKYRVVQNVQCEHNLRHVPPLIGTVVVTNFKVMFKPNETQSGVTDEQKLAIVGKSRVQDFFRVPLGQLFSIDVRTFVQDDNKIKHSCIEMATKDGRRMSIILHTFEDCSHLKDLIRHITFLDGLQPLTRQMQSYFAVQYYETFETLIQSVGPQNVPNHGGIFQENKLQMAMKLFNQNQEVWSRYQDPIVEFTRQGCVFPERQRQLRDAVF